MSYNPDDPAWLNRDRFVLSAGHGSMFLYSWLHMSGYDLSMEEVQNFRAKDSKTPGHPEFGWTPGVESTTGPLGQGVGNGVTLDKMAEHTQSEDVAMRFEAQGWEVLEIDGHDMNAITKAYQYAKTSDNGKPTLIVCKTIIGKGIDEIAGTCAAHGEAGVKYADDCKEGLGLDADNKWFVSPETYKYFDGRKAALKKTYDEWQTKKAAWAKANPDKAKALDAALAGDMPDLNKLIPEFEKGKKYATRNT